MLHHTQKAFRSLKTFKALKPRNASTTWGWWAVVVIAAICWPDALRAQMKAEYFVDEDPGLGHATTVAKAFGADGTLLFDVPTDGLAAGEHIVGIRAYSTTTNSQGQSITTFGPTITSHVLVHDSQQEAQKVLYAEYFWGEDPGYGKGTPIAITPGQEVTLDNLSISTEGLAVGEHLLSIRTYGTSGWGPTITGRVLIHNNQQEAQKILYAEYFWDDDPGYGKGTSIAITPGQEVTLDNLSVSTEGLAAGEHLLSMRTYGTSGWGPTITGRVLVHDNQQEAQKVLYAEYFWGDDPGYGKGTPITITPGQEVNIEDLQIPTGEAHGSSILSIRAYGTMGWGPTIVADVLVDASGNYTLNAASATSYNDRNYQSLGDLFTDLSDRGVGDDVTLTVVGTATDYALDATTNEVVEQLAAIASGLDNTATSRDERVITFTAAEGSGNSLSITTTDDALPTVVGFFAHIATENVALTINGIAYDFTASSVRHQELCPGTATQPVALSDISSAVNVTWVAQPHSGTTITGYDTSGTGNLPAMTLVNRGTQCDSLTVAVTLSDGSSHTLTTYDYTYLVHANVATQTFTTLTPANGSSLDPGTTQLTWSAIGDAVGYRVTILSQPMGDETAEPTETVVETDQRTCDLTVESGMKYTWTVTALGACDELTSAPMTLTGRLLPDLAVAAITLPDAAEAGNALTVSATITNQGAGATTEGTWTDRLYYTVNSTSFDDAVLLAEVRHNGNVGAGESYTAVFETATPMADSGQLRVFVITDAAEEVLESDDTNNHMMSTGTAELKPFYMNSDDLAALRQLYADFGGASWTGEPWDATSTIIRSGNWSGVTFDSDGRVIAINLQGRGLSGALSAATAPALPLLTTLNLSRNALTGDAATFVDTDKMPALTTLNLSYNQLEELSSVLPAALSIDLTNQHRTYGNNKVFPGIDDMAPIVLTVASDLTVALPAIATYNHAKQAFTAHSQLRVYDRSYQQVGTLSWSAGLTAYTFSPNEWKVTAAQDMETVVEPVTSSGNNYTNARGSVFRATLHFTTGDANLSGWTDVNDVQRTLNYVLDTNNTSTFGLWAANTFDDDTYDPADETINIQDIVSTVNIVLDNEGGAQNAPRRVRANGDEPGEAVALFFADNHKVMVDATEEVAAFSMELSGVSANQVRLLLNAQEWQMQTRNTDSGVRLVVFSPTGSTLPIGTTTLLRLSGDGQPVGVQATDAMAEELNAAVSGSPSHIVLAGTATDIRVTSGEGRHVVVHAAYGCGPTDVSVYSPSGMLLTRQHLDTLPAGATTLRLATAADVVIVAVSNKETGTTKHTITLRP